MTEQTLPLDGVTVLELDLGLAQYAGKLMADLGARVIKVEPPEGAPTRQAPPHLESGESVPFAHYNTCKRSVVLDPAAPEGRERLHGLIRRADVLLDGLGPDGAERLGLTEDVLGVLRPGLVHVAITPFGLTGPWRDLAACDLVSMALGGVTAQTGYDSVDGAPARPITPAGGQAAHFAGVLAATYAVAALNAPRPDKVTILDVAVHDAIAVSTEIAVSMWEFGGQTIYRHTGRHAAAPFTTPRWQFRCADGRYLCALTLYLNDRRFATICDWFDAKGFEHDLRDDRFRTERQRDVRMQEIVDTIARFCAAFPSDDLFAEAQERAIPWAKVLTPAEIAADEHLHARGFYTDVEHEDGRRLPYPGMPWTGMPTAFTSATPGRRRRAPRVGEDNDLILSTPPTL